MNPLIDIIQFFSENIAQDLQADIGSVHPILQVDAIRFLYTFRYQVQCQLPRLSQAGDVSYP